MRQLCTKLLRCFALVVISIFAIPQAYSNDLTIANATQLSPTSISFDISWENSWLQTSDPNSSHDAVWLYVKYRRCGTTFNGLPFVSLPISAGGHTISPSLTFNAIDAAPFNTGIMLRRATQGSGSVSGAVVLNVTFPDAANYEIRVFALEMTYILQESFYVGDGSASGIHNTLGRGDDLAQPFFISGENSIAVGTGAGELYSAGNPKPTANIPAAYPKGFNAFYCMKYEVTQQNYADFLNSLNLTQFIARYAAGPGGGYTLQGNWPNVHTGGFPSRAISGIGWHDLTAFLDWSGLRPISDLEFDKICRGPVFPIPGELAWGSTTAVAVASKVGSAECETASNAGAEGVCNGLTDGAMRVGFLGSSSSTRTTIGAGYYGNLELSGNVLEQFVTIQNEGLNYTGLRGDGALTSGGESDVTGWPAMSGNNGHSYKGGDWFNDPTGGRVLGRFFVSLAAHDRYTNVGGRGCR